MMFEDFLSPYVIADLFSENAFLGITALGMTLVILSGGIDLSVGSVIGFTTIFVATMIADHNIAPWQAWTIALAMGTLFGGLMGALIHFFQLPAFLVTLAGLFFARGMAFYVKPEAVQIRHDTYDALADVIIPVGAGAEVGVPTILFFATLLAMLVLAHYTRLGRNIYAIGGDELSAKLMGIPVGKTKIAVYAINGLCSALAGTTMTIYMDSGNPINASALELDAIAIVVIGGTLLSGGVGTILGTLLGFTIYATIYQIIYFSNLGSSMATVAMGGLLLSFIILQRMLVGSRDDR